MCSKCLNADRGYTVHCGKCGCCNLRFNWAFLITLGVSCGLLWVSYELFCGIMHVVQKVGRHG